MKTAEEILFTHFSTEGPMQIFKTSVIAAMCEYEEVSNMELLIECNNQAFKHGYYKGVCQKLIQIIETNAEMPDILYMALKQAVIDYQRDELVFKKDKNK